MKLVVLGSAAGGGFPQWNCNCVQCSAVRRGSPRHQSRTQSSVAVGGPQQWVLCNASPDILAQLRATPALQPAHALRDTGIAGVVLCDGQVDHTTGLYMLREHRSALPLWCTDPVHEDLTRGNPIFNVLGHYCGVARHRIALDGSGFEVPGVAGLRIHPLPLDSKPAPYSPHRERPVPGDNLGLSFEHVTTGRRLFYAPGLGEITPMVWEAMTQAHTVMVDGTFWTDDEMIAMGLSSKSARDIGHLPQSGRGGMLEHLARLPHSTRKVLIHINNTNPILDQASAQRRQLDDAGIEVAHDGMEIDL